MKLATWNVNSLRIREDAVLDWLEQNRPDVLCMQETKLTDQEFPEDAFGDLNYDTVYWGQRSYNGVAIASGPEMLDVKKGLPDDEADGEPRLISATIEGIRVYSVYVPNGQEVGSPRFQYKLRFIERLKRHLIDHHRPSDQVIVAGDFNVAPADIDVFDPVAVKGQLLASEPERAALRDLLTFGLIDALRHADPAGEKRFTWWDYRSGGWERDMGLRIDHILATKPVIARMKRITIDEKERGKPQPSDHVPVVLELQ